MNASIYTLIGIALCAIIIIALCVLAVRRFERIGLSDAPQVQDDDVLELDRLSFDQLADPAVAKTKAHESPTEARREPKSSPDAAATPLANVEFGVRPETLIMDGMRPRLECAMALLNQTETTLVSIRLSSDLVIYEPQENQATRPNGPTMRQDTVARLAPGERIIIHGDWKLPEGLSDLLTQDGEKGTYLLIRNRIIGANVAPKSQFFLIGHLRNDSRLVPIGNSPDAWTNLGVTEAKAPNS